MSLIQNILTDIEANARAQSALALKHFGRITEAEVLIEFLREHGALGVEPIYYPALGVLEIHDHSTDGSVRRALAQSDLQIAEEFELDTICEAPNSRSVRLVIKGLDCSVVLHRDPLQLALAA